MMRKILVPLVVVLSLVPAMPAQARRADLVFAQSAKGHTHSPAGPMNEALRSGWAWNLGLIAPRPGPGVGTERRERVRATSDSWIVL